MDPERMNVLFRKLPVREAEDMIGRALEELAVRLSQADVLWRQRDHQGLRKSVRSMIGIADQVGLISVAQVAEGVIHSLDVADAVATAAAVARLQRVGDTSLGAVWDLHDLSL